MFQQGRLVVATAFNSNIKLAVRTSLVQGRNRQLHVSATTSFDNERKRKTLRLLVEQPTQVHTAGGVFCQPHTGNGRYDTENPHQTDIVLPTTSGLFYSQRVAHTPAAARSSSQQLGGRARGLHSARVRGAGQAADRAARQEVELLECSDVDGRQECGSSYSPDEASLDANNRYRNNTHITDSTDMGLTAAEHMHPQHRNQATLPGPEDELFGQRSVLSNNRQHYNNNNNNNNLGPNTHMNAADQAYFIKIAELGLSLSEAAQPGSLARHQAADREARQRAAAELHSELSAVSEGIAVEIESGDMDGLPKPEEMLMTRVLKKKRRKMNRHKYKKWRKKMRFKLRALGK